MDIETGASLRHTTPVLLVEEADEELDLLIGKTRSGKYLTLSWASHVRHSWATVLK